MTLADRAESAVGKRQCRDPYGAFAILDQFDNNEPSQLGVRREFAGLPACQPFHRSDPKRSVACGEQAIDRGRREMLIGWRLPRDVPHTIEPKQAELRTQPEIPVGRLGDGGNGPPRETFSDPPGRVRVLTAIQRRIERERVRAQRQHRTRDRNARRDDVSS